MDLGEEVHIIADEVWIEAREVSTRSPRALRQHS